MNNAENKGEIVIYQSADGTVNLDARLENETIWLTQKGMTELFGVKIPAVNKHINNIYKEQELSVDSTVSILEIVQKEGMRDVSRQTTFYNLDMIIAVGYRINSKRATQFRIWATSTLKEYLTKGYVINEKKLRQEQDKVKTLQNTIQLLSRSLAHQVENLEEAQNIAKLLDNFAQGLDLLDNFDHKTLIQKGKIQKKPLEFLKKNFCRL